jgi:hypothetical protein
MQVEEVRKGIVRRLPLAKQRSHRGRLDFGFARLTGCGRLVCLGAGSDLFSRRLRRPPAVALRWVRAYVTFQSGARLITDVEMED